MSNPWTILSKKICYENPWISLTEFDVLNPAGNKGIYGKVHFKNLAIGILALDAQSNLYLVGQYRFTLDSYSWEIPEGGCPQGQDPLEAAKRELKEETGLVADNWQLLLNLHLSNSVTDEYAFLFLATELTQQEACPEETEKIITRKVDIEAALNMIAAGEITDAMSVAAIFKIKIMLADGNL